MEPFWNEEREPAFRANTIVPETLYGYAAKSLST